MLKALAISTIIMTILLVASCSDDNPVTPESFLFTIEVVDTAGNPVSGLKLSLAADLPYYQDGLFSPGKAAVVIPFNAAVSCSTRILIKDVSGTQVRELLSSQIPAGSHHIMWNGQNDEGTHLNSGVYVAHFNAMDLDSGTLIFEDHAAMYMAILDADRNSVGTTDGRGMIKLSDKKHFPHLYDVPDIPALNENSEQIGIIQFSSSMRFQLVDQINGGSFTFYDDVSGSGSLKVVWDTSVVKQCEFETRKTVDVTNPEWIEGNFFLGSPYPMPFN